MQHRPAPARGTRSWSQANRRRFGATVERLRTARGMTRVELGERSGFDPAVIAGIEKGRRLTLYLGDAEALAVALGVPVSALYPRSRPASQRTSKVPRAANPAAKRREP